MALIGGIVARDRQVAKTIRDGDADLHNRIDDVRDRYVRRDDLDGHLARLDATMKDLKADMKEHSATTNSRLDQLLVALQRHDK